MKKIIVYCEKIPHTDKMSDVSYELINKAYKVAQESKSMIENEDFYITAVVLSSEIDKNEELSVNRAFICVKGNKIKIETW